MRVNDKQWLARRVAIKLVLPSDARYMRVQKEQGICDQSHGSHGHNRYVRKLLPGKRCNIIYNRNLRENLGEFWQNTLRELLLS
jgi:hypothetical protein